MPHGRVHELAVIVLFQTFQVLLPYMQMFSFRYAPDLTQHQGKGRFSQVSSIRDNYLFFSAGYSRRKV
ncbi:MAG: hypothetical protein CSA34_06070 [Desulfobulbus propionicus]|nr:MAG: hypothetical protein CSA34_06070 [Desulfobulbus propionicus]